jgi:hypothetical protein
MLFYVAFWLLRQVLKVAARFVLFFVAVTSLLP